MNAIRIVWITIMSPIVRGCVICENKKAIVKIKEDIINVKEISSENSLIRILVLGTKDKRILFFLKL